MNYNVPTMAQAMATADDNAANQQRIMCDAVATANKLKARLHDIQDSALRLRADLAHYKKGLSEELENMDPNRQFVALTKELVARTFGRIIDNRSDEDATVALVNEAMAAVENAEYACGNADQEITFLISVHYAAIVEANMDFNLADAAAADAVAFAAAEAVADAADAAAFAAAFAAAEAVAAAADAAYEAAAFRAAEAVAAAADAAYEAAAFAAAEAVAV